VASIASGCSRISLAARLYRKASALVIVTGLRREQKQIEGHNAQPVNDGRCCEDCNWMVVVPRRLGMFGLDDQDAGALAEAFRANEGGSGD